MDNQDNNKSAWNEPFYQTRSIGKCLSIGISFLSNRFLQIMKLALPVICILALFTTIVVYVRCDASLEYSIGQTLLFKVFATVANPTNKLTESDWQELAERVEKYVPTFRHEMNKRKTLSEDEYRLCLLTLINVPPSSANELLDRDSTFATNTRKRLHKKIFGVEGSSTDFDRRLRQML